MIDETSLHILNILQEKARIPNVEVARQVGMAPSAVLERIRKMERRGIIDGYEVRLNPRRFHRGLIAFVLVTVQRGEAAAVGRLLADLPDAQEVHFIAGEDGYLVKVRVADTAALGAFVTETLAALPGILSTRTMTVLGTIKETARIPITEPVHDLPDPEPPHDVPDIPDDDTGD